MNYQEYSHIKVVLQDVLCSLEEVLEARVLSLMACGPDDSEAKVQGLLGEVRGIKAAMSKLQNTGGEQINEMVYDRRY